MVLFIEYVLTHTIPNTEIFCYIRTLALFDQFLVHVSVSCESATSVAYYLDPDDCEGYFICYPGMPPYKLTCPFGQSFNLDLYVCTPDASCLNG